MPESIVTGTELRVGQSKILVVDDEQTNVNLLRTLLQLEGYTSIAANYGRDAIAAAREHLPDLILLDFMMPGMTGAEVARVLKADPATKNIPIIMITGMSDRQSRMQALESGVEEFLEKPVDRIELTVRVRNLLRLKEYQDFLENHNVVLEQQVEERTKQLTVSYRETILTLTRAAEYKDEDTGAHIQRIGHYSAQLAQTLGLDAAFRDEIFHASPMHDIGKIGIPDGVLLKPGGLDATDWEVMKRHTLIGASVLSTGVSPYVVMGAQIARSHHERWDGTGYPDALAGDKIPLAARIVCICDVYDALRSKRPYKPAFSHEHAIELILVGDGRTRPEHFDPEILERFRRMGRTFAEIYDSVRD